MGNYAFVWDIERALPPFRLAYSCNHHENPHGVWRENCQRLVSCAIRESPLDHVT